MRVLGVVVVLALAAAARGDEIYRWTDDSGHVHYSNSSAPDSGATRVPSAPQAGRPERETTNEPGENAPGDPETFSAGVSLRRNALERDLRATERRLREIDTRLATLARARQQNAAGSSATGGVGANLDLRSEEEKSLAAEREQLAQHAAEVKSDGARLRQEVTARSGGTTPDWWIDLR
jgi:uncharacterized protein DUF4124